MRGVLTTANAIFAAACLLGLLCVGCSAFYILYSREKAIDSFGNRLAVDSAIISSVTSLILSHVDYILIDAASTLNDEDLLRSDTADLRRQLELLSTGSIGVSGMFVLDRVGDAVATLAPSTQDNRSFADRPYFYEQMDRSDNSLFVQTTDYSRVVKQWRIYLSRPLISKNLERVGVVGAAINPQILTSLYSHFNPLPGAVVALVDSDYKLLARYPEDSSLYGTSFKQAVIFQRLSESEADAVTAVANSIVDGRERLAVARRLAGTHLSLAVSVPVDEILVGWRTEATAVLATGGILALVLVAAGWEIGRRQLHQDAAAGQLDDMLTMAPAGIAVLDDSGQFVRQNGRWRQFADDLRVPREARRSLSGFLDNLRSRALLTERAAQIAPPSSGAPAAATSFGIALNENNERLSFEIVVQSAMNAREPRKTGYIALIIDSTEHEKLQSLLREQLVTDVVTGMRNRRGLTDAIGDSLSAGNVTGVLFVFEFLDVDELIASRGYDDSDQIIAAIAARLRSLEPSGAIVARLYGCVFAVFCAVADGGRGIDAGTLRRLLEGEYRLEGHTTFIRLAIGGAEQKGQPAFRLLQAAEMALGRARRNGAARTVISNPELELASRERVELFEALQRAVRDRQFVLYYQPKVSLETLEIVALEALVRWRHPIFGLQGPSLFLPLAEATGLIVDIGDWVMEEVCRQQATWQSAGRRVVPVAVNVSPIQFDHRNIVEQLSTCVAASGVDRASIIVEVTETTMSDNMEEMLDAVRTLRTAGVRVALDDFGSGYSSLGAIAEMSIDEVKIDRSFIENIETNPISQQIVETIVAIGRTLDLSVTAEGVETEGQRSVLRGAGCSFAQGYLFHRPMPAGDVEALLRRSSAGSA